MPCTMLRVLCEWCICMCMCFFFHYSCCCWCCAFIFIHILCSLSIMTLTIHNYDYAIKENRSIGVYHQHQHQDLVLPAVKSLGSFNNKRKLSLAYIHAHLHTHVYCIVYSKQFDSIAIEFETVRFSCRSLVFLISSSFSYQRSLLHVHDPYYAWFCAFQTNEKDFNRKLQMIIWHKLIFLFFSLSISLSFFLSCFCLHPHLGWCSMLCVVKSYWTHVEINLVTDALKHTMKRSKYRRRENNNRTNMYRWKMCLCVCVQTSVHQITSARCVVIS